MHQLIAKDLKEYVTRVLGEALVYGHVDFGSISEMVTEIVSASDGVFLWVVLVSNSLSRGIRNSDSHQELWQRLNSLPRDLEGLYQDMWLRQNEDDEIYQTSSAKLLYLNLLISRSWVGESGSLFVPTVFELMAAMDDKVLDYHLIPRHYPLEELRRRCQAAVKIIRVRSAGLLEIFDVPENDLGYDFPFSSLVDFIHRSAEDFLTDTQQGRAVWADHGMTYDLAFTKLYLARLASLSYSVGKPSGDNSWEVREQLHMLTINRESFEPSTIRHCLQETTKWWHYFSTPAVDQTYPGRHVVLVEASRLGFFDYVSERLSAEQDESSAVPQLFLHSTCTHGWVRTPYTSTDAVHRNVIDGQCRLLRLFLDKVSFRDPKSFILPPVGDRGLCHSISQTLGHVLRFIRHSLDVNGAVCAEALLDTLEAFKGTPVDLTEKVLLSLDFVTDHFLTPPFEQYVKMSLFRPGVSRQSPETERVQMEISLGDWVDLTRAGLLGLIDDNHSVTRDKSCTPRARFTSLIRWNTANELCMHTLNESDANHLSHMAQELLYSLFTRCFGRLPHRHTLYQNLFDEVTSLREGRVESVVETVDAVGERA
ncbi:hypothetical protein CEP53_002412 [Fusarium sp. AF-6]|nr:hypothetical protein CEP53_002412 [Fusarium sp. AF-6]